MIKTYSFFIKTVVFSLIGWTSLWSQCEKPVANFVAWGFCRNSSTELKTLQDGIDLNAFQGDDSLLRYYSSEFSTTPLKLSDEIAAGSFVWAATFDEETGCESDRKAVMVVYIDAFTPLGESEQTFCDPNATVSDIVTDTGNRYYLSDDPSDNPISALTPLEDGKTYYISNRGASCTSTRFAVTVSLDCESLSMNNFVVDKGFSVSPNPTQGMVTIESKDGLAIQSIEIYNLRGQLVLSIPQVVQNSFDVSKLSKGIYIVNVKTDKGVSTTKLVKE
ncbi:MAG: T9SS type A sorting domain-containing protein [Flavobacteriales bacterium]|nr:T9SS type A sorting domain-containing protein [Flavobacteriales bacterium]